MKKLLFVFSVYMACNQPKTTQYSVPVKHYISKSSTASDSNNGLDTAHSWLTLGKLSTAIPVAGDSVLLRAGDTWIESLPVASSVTYSSYGTGPKPIISGLRTLSAWIAASNGIYEIPTPSTQVVLINGAVQAMGRFPNSGYIPYQSGSNGSITSNSIATAPNFIGGQLVIRMNRSYTDRCIITNQTTTNVTYTPQSGSTPTGGFGFFFENSFNTLDAFGEWYYNNTTKRLQVFFGINNPIPYFVQASTIDTLVQANKISNVVISGLQFTGANKAAISVYGGANFTINNCSFLFCGKDAVVLNGTNVVSVTNSYFEYCLNVGINANVKQYGAIKIQDDTIRHTAQFAGMAHVKSSEGGMEAILVGATSLNSIVRRNYVTGTGYIGIRVDMSNGTIVDSNVVDSTCMLKDDGGGIYTWNNNGSGQHTGFKIIHNVVTNTIGAPVGTNSSNAEGEPIYLDDYSNGAEVGWNVISGGQRGIFCHDAFNIYIHDNLVFNTNQAFRTRHDAGALMTGFNVVRNQFFAKASNQYCAYHDGVDITQLGALDSNWYCRPISETSVIKSGSSTYTLASWKAYSKKDVHSNKTSATVTSVSKIYFYYNPTFVSATIGASGSKRGIDGTIYSVSITIPALSGIILMDL